MSDPWDSEQRRPPADTDADWPERDLWQSWDRPAEPGPEPAAEGELPWAEAEGDELWSDSVGSRPVSTTPWTGPTWDDQPWAEPAPGEPRPDLSAFTGPLEVAEPTRELEPRDRNGAWREVSIPQEVAPEPAAQLEPAESADSAPWEATGRLEPVEEPAWTAEPSTDPPWAAPEPIAEPAWQAPDLGDAPWAAAAEALPEWGEPQPAEQAGEPEPREEAPEAEPSSEPEPEPSPEPAPEPELRSAPAEAAADLVSAESVSAEPPVEASDQAEHAEQAEPAEQAFAAFAPEREPEAPPEPVRLAIARPRFEPDVEPEEPEERPAPYPPFEVIDGGAFPASDEDMAGEIETSLGAEEDWDGRSERRQPTTAETVVPWLIGLILLLSGMVIVLLALIFTSDNGLLAGVVSPSGQATANVALVPSADPAASPSPSSAASSTTPKPSATPKPPPTYGALDMVYLGRSAPLAHIYLLRHDFTADEKPTVLAQDPAQDVDRLAWSPDGTHGAGIIGGRLVAIQQGKPKRALADGIVASTFSPDGAMLYALRIVLGNGTDRAEVLQIIYASGDVKKLTEWTFPRPVIGAESPVKEAQFADEGGSQRIYFMNDKTLRIWMLGAPTYGVTTTGRTTKLSDVTLPTLWAGDGMKHIELTESGEATTLTLRSPDGGELAKTTAKGLVSHLRWAPDDSQVTFTLGRTVGNGVQQDLFLWDLTKNKAPMQLTNTGAAFGAEWLGTSESWRP